MKRFGHFICWVTINYLDLSFSMDAMIQWIALNEIRKKKRWFIKESHSYINTFTGHCIEWTLHSLGTAFTGHCIQSLNYFCHLELKNNSKHSFMTNKRVQRKILSLENWFNRHSSGKLLSNLILRNVKYLCNLIKGVQTSVW